MLPIKVALVSKSNQVSAADIAKAAAAINVQVTRDFAPIWSVNATVSSLPNANAIPPGIWPVFIVDKLPPGEGGVHLTKHKQPYALVAAGASWSLAASHETLEMLADPSGNRLVASQAIQVVGNQIKDAPGKFEYLTEVCDPSEGDKFAYLIDDVVVSDFYTPHFFDPVQAAGVRYSFTGALTGPRQVLPDGYISWLNPMMNEFQQLRYFGEPEIVNLGSPGAEHANLRAFADAKARTTEKLAALPETAPVMQHRAKRREALAAAAAQLAKNYDQVK